MKRFRLCRYTQPVEFPADWRKYGWYFDFSSHKEVYQHPITLPVNIFHAAVCVFGETATRMVGWEQEKIL